MNVSFFSQKYSLPNYKFSDITKNMRLLFIVSPMTRLGCKYTSHIWVEMLKARVIFLHAYHILGNYT